MGNAIGLHLMRDQNPLHHTIVLAWLIYGMRIEVLFPFITT